MKTQSVSLNVSPAIGKVSGAYTIPVKSTCIITLAHGAGADMHHSFMVTLSNALAQAGIATLRFNFPFMEHKKDGRIHLLLRIWLLKQQLPMQKRNFRPFLFLFLVNLLVAE